MAISPFSEFISAITEFELASIFSIGASEKNVIFPDFDCKNCALLCEAFRIIQAQIIFSRNEILKILM